MRARRPAILTAFGPFPGCPDNPTGPLALAVADRLARRNGPVFVRVLPTTWGAPEALLRAIVEERPRAVIALGLAGSRATVEVERWAVNAAGTDAACAAAARADAAGRSRTGPLDPQAPLRLEGVLHRPFEGVVEALIAEGLPIGWSDDAGSYLCNALFFRLLRGREQDNLSRSAPIGFVHVPGVSGTRPERFSEIADVLTRLVSGLLTVGDRESGPLRSGPLP